jgi:hypothetical protein
MAVTVHALSFPLSETPLPPPSVSQQPSAQPAENVCLLIILHDYY